MCHGNAATTTWSFRPSYVSHDDVNAWRTSQASRGNHTAFETYSRYCSQKISRSYPNQIEYLMLLVGYVSVQFRNDPGHNVRRASTPRRIHSFDPEPTILGEQQFCSLVRKSWCKYLRILVVYNFEGLCIW